MTPTIGRPKNHPGIRAWNGAALRLRRLALHRPAFSVAAEVGVSESTVRRWERNENAPTADQVRALAGIMRCRPAHFARKPTLR